MIEFGHLSHVGLRRELNEDTYYGDAELGLWLVADGMGGHEFGEVASALARDAVVREVRAGRSLTDAIRRADEDIIRHSRQRAESLPMGTTMVALRIHDNRFELAWVGDSRAYLVSATGIEQLTRDHSWVQMMIDAGELKPAEAEGHAWRNIILHCLGREEPLEIGVTCGTLKPDELLLLCSDGLTNELTDAQIQASCTFADTLENLVEQLIAQANEHGGRDNISCIVIGRTATPPAAESRGRRFINMLLKPLKS